MAPTLPRLILKKDRDRSVLNRHPWIFSGGVHEVELPREDPGNRGGIVQVVSSSGQALGAGFYEGESQIRCRLFHFGEIPATGFTTTYWEERLRRARRLRQDLLPGATSGFRLVHSESDGMPGLICDVYADTAVIQKQHPGADAILPILLDFLAKELGTQHVYLQSSGHGGSHHNGEWIRGNNPRVEFQERGMAFLADITGGQKTGFFLDQRDNRRLVEEWSRGRTVLNAFAYTAAFSVAALRGGANFAESVDLSAPALELGEENVARNGGADRHHSVKEDCFEYLRKIEADRFDLIILDPPAFAKTKSAVDRAARGYKDINLQAMKRIRSGGLIFTFSCSHHVSTDLFRKILFAAAADSGRDVKILDSMTQATDHPINIYHPEGEYLKGFLLRVDLP